MYSPPEDNIDSVFSNLISSLISTNLDVQYKLNCKTYIILICSKKIQFCKYFSLYKIHTIIYIYVYIFLILATTIRIYARAHTFTEAMSCVFSYCSQWFPKAGYWHYQFFFRFSPVENFVNISVSVKYWFFPRPPEDLRCRHSSPPPPPPPTRLPNSRTRAFSL